MTSNITYSSSEIKHMRKIDGKPYYYVISFSSHGGAEVEAEDLRKAGFPSRIITSKSKKRFRYHVYSIKQPKAYSNYY